MNEENILQIGDFRIRQYRNDYYINLQNRYECDDCLAEMFDMKYEEYIEILEQFHAHLDDECDEYFFEKLEDTIKCTEYLNEKYGVMLKLVGELDG